MRKADNLPPSCAVVTKSGNLNFLETSRAVQACNGTALTLPYIYVFVMELIFICATHLILRTYFVVMFRRVTDLLFR